MVSFTFMPISVPSMTNYSGAHSACSIDLCHEQSIQKVNFTSHYQTFLRHSQTSSRVTSSTSWEFDTCDPLKCGLVTVHISLTSLILQGYSFNSWWVHNWSFLLFIIDVSLFLIVFYAGSAVAVEWIFQGGHIQFSLPHKLNQRQLNSDVGQTVASLSHTDYSWHFGDGF